METIKIAWDGPECGRNSWSRKAGTSNAAPRAHLAYERKDEHAQEEKCGKEPVVCLVEHVIQGP
eukprot:3574804-Prymnesium_polylepis.4